MKTIKFSFKYAKLMDKTGKPFKEGRLLYVIKTKFEDLHPNFKLYDTIYFDEVKGAGFYALPPKGDCLVLIFLSGDNLFSTIRRSTPEKAKYYEACVGSDFEFIIAEASP